MIKNVCLTIIILSPLFILNAYARHSDAVYQWELEQQYAVIDSMKRKPSSLQQTPPSFPKLKWKKTSKFRAWQESLQHRVEQNEANKK